MVGAVSGCASDPDIGTDAPDRSGTPTTPVPGHNVAPTIESEVDLGSAKQPRPYDEIVALAIADNEQWWSEAFPELYGTGYTPLTGGIYASYPGRPEPIPGCSGAAETTADELAAYVAFYCADHDFLAYDDGPESGFVTLTEEFGASVVAVVISHEWAHAIQKRTGIFSRDVATVYTEQHADCIAGAWVGRAYRGESNLIRFDDEDLRSALLAIAEVRDPVGGSQYDEDAHGLAFDRLGAFQTGFTDGLTECALLVDAPLPLTRNEFLPYSDEAHTGGDSPFSCDDSPQSQCSTAAELLRDDLNDFWSERIEGFPEIRLDMEPQAGCGNERPNGEVLIGDGVIACPASALVIDERTVAEGRHRDFGDFGAGYLYGIAWAEIGLTLDRSPLAGEARSLARDCLMGEWAADINPEASGTTRRNGARLAPGDLDETLEVAIGVADQTMDEDRVGSPIEKIQALRTGVFDADCERYLQPDA